MHVSILDYGASNLLNVVRAFEALNVRVSRIETPEAVLDADRLILPGVGAFGAAVQSLTSKGLFEAAQEFFASGKPILGICLGMQLLATKSDEFGMNFGLDIIPGRVEKMPQLTDGGARLKVPHIGWNELEFAHESNHIFTGIKPASPMYFVHSYLYHTDVQNETLAKCDYKGIEVPAIVCKDNAIGFQFHPEKSGRMGLHLLQNFTRL